jgi:hypothetical protein
MDFLVTIAILSVIFLVVASRCKKTVAAAPGAHRPPGAPCAVPPQRVSSVYRSVEKTCGSAPGVTAFPVTDGGDWWSDVDGNDLVDALTGALLQPDAGLFQCRRCRVFYQQASVEVLRAENDGRCIGCLQAELVCVRGRREQYGLVVGGDAFARYNYRRYAAQVSAGSSAKGRKGNLIACVM